MDRKGSSIYDRSKLFIKQKKEKTERERKRKEEASPNRVMRRKASIFDSPNDQERVENRLIVFGRERDRKISEKRKRREEAEEKYDFKPKIYSKPNNKLENDV